MSDKIFSKYIFTKNVLTDGKVCSVPSVGERELLSDKSRIDANINCSFYKSVYSINSGCLRFVTFVRKRK